MEEIQALREDIARLTQMNARLKDKNAKLIKALEERSKVNIVFTHQQIRSRHGGVKTIITPICVADESEEGKQMYVDLLTKLNSSTDTIPKDIDWMTNINIPVNEARHLPEGLQIF